LSVTGAIRSFYSLSFTLHVSSLLTLLTFILTSLSLDSLSSEHSAYPSILIESFGVFKRIHHYSGTSHATEGLSGLYELLLEAGKETPVAGNQNGSYLTMKSNQGLVFGAVTVFSGFSGVFCDQGYWQRVACNFFSVLIQTSYICFM
jgi:hypothetical protein